MHRPVGHGLFSKSHFTYASHADAGDGVATAIDGTESEEVVGGKGTAICVARKKAGGGWRRVLDMSAGKIKGAKRTGSSLLRRTPISL